MAITATWPEYHGTEAWASPVTTDISNTNWGSTDASNIVTTTFPITNNTRSFFKRQAVKFTGFAAEQVSDFRLYALTGLVAAGQFTSPATDTLTFLDVGNQTTPVSAPNANDIVGGNMPNSLPGAANITTSHPGGIADANGEGTNFFVHQVFVHTDSTVGRSATLAMRYSVTG